MQIIQIPEVNDPIATINGRLLEPGKEYICTNAFAGVMLLSRNKVMVGHKAWSLRALLKSYSIDFASFDPDEDWNDKQVWLLRGGGYGDLLMVTPLIREMKRRWPSIQIIMACGKQYWPIFDHLDVQCELLPIPYDKQTRIDALISFEEAVEGDPLAQELHMAQLFANRAGITLTDLVPDYHITIEEKAWVQRHYPHNGLPRVGMQLLASALYRTYPKMDEVMLKLSKKAQVFLIGAPGQIELIEEVPNVTNLMDRRLDFRHSAALISSCDVCVSPDSALTHVCAALRVPCVSLYGPFSSSLRETGQLAYSFNGRAPCAPCFFHAEISNQFPEGKPCSKIKRCVALDSIDTNDVVNKVTDIIDHGFSPGGMNFSRPSNVSINC